MSLRRKAQINNIFVKILEVFLKEFISKNGYLLMLVKDTEKVTYLIYIYNIHIVISILLQIIIILYIVITDKHLYSHFKEVSRHFNIVVKYTAFRTSRLGIKMALPPTNFVNLVRHSDFESLNFLLYKMGILIEFASLHISE